MTSLCSFGPLTIDLRFSPDRDPIAARFFEELDPVPDTVGPADIRLAIQDTPLDLAGRRYFAGNCIYAADAILIKEANFAYTAHGLFSGSTIDLVLWYDTSEIDRSKTSDVRENRISTLRNAICSYNFLWMIMHLALLKRGAAFIHAGTIVMEQRAWLFAGTGGSGKTSVATGYLEKDRVSYLSEDFGIVDQNGRSFFSPKTATIYASDVKYGQTDLVRYVESTMPAEDRARWAAEIEKGKNPRRKVSPRTLFGNKCDLREAPIGVACFISREDIGSVSIDPVGVEEFSRRAMNASFREIKRVCELLYHARAAFGEDLNYPTLSELEEKTIAVYLGALKDKRTLHIRAPRQAPPDDIIAAVDLATAR